MSVHTDLSEAEKSKAWDTLVKMMKRNPDTEAQSRLKESVLALMEASALFIRHQ